MLANGAAESYQSLTTSVNLGSTFAFINLFSGGYELTKMIFIKILTTAYGRNLHYYLEHLLAFSSLILMEFFWGLWNWLSFNLSDPINAQNAYMPISSGDLSVELQMVYNSKLEILYFVPKLFVIPLLLLLLRGTRYLLSTKLYSIDCSFHPFGFDWAHIAIRGFLSQPCLQFTFQQL